MMRRSSGQRRIQPRAVRHATAPAPVLLASYVDPATGRMLTVTRFRGLSMIPRMLAREYDDWRAKEVTT